MNRTEAVLDDGKVESNSGVLEDIFSALIDGCSVKILNDPEFDNYL
jgi:hypothetical protein